MLKNFFKNQGSIALILVIMITSLTLISAVALTLINVSERMANYQLEENEDVLNQKQACLDDALVRISNNNYATGTYALDLTDIHCYYQISETVTGLKTVTTTASSLSSVGIWSQSLRAIVNVSSTPISINSYQDIVGPTWDSSAWAGRIRISVQPNKVAGDLYNFPVYVDLATLGVDFFDLVQSDGGDIVVTLGDGTTKLLRELVAIDTGAADTGELHFLAPYLSSQVATDFYIYFANAAANETNDDGVWVDYKVVQHLNNDPSGAAPQMIDSSVNNYDGTSAGAMTSGDLVTGQLGIALDFDGVNDYISLTNTDYVDLGTDDFTISYWVKTTTLSTNYMVAKYASTNDRWYTRLDSGGRLQFYNVIGGTARLQMYPSAVVGLDSGQWAHLIFSADRDTSNYIYKNGQSIALANNVTYTGDAYNGSDFRIGAYTTIVFTGQLDEFRFTKRAFSANRISTEYNNQSSASTFYSTSTIEVL